MRGLTVSHRSSQDSHVNGHGRKLLTLLNDYNLLVANGRVCGDLTGKFTCCQWNGLSVVDMLIMQRSVFHRLNNFKVENFDWCSDHALISFSLRVKIENRHKKFKEALQTAELRSRLNSFTNTDFFNVNIATDTFTEILQMALQRVFPKRPNKRSYNIASRMGKKKIPYSRDCQIAKRAFKKAQRRFKQDKGNLNRRQMFIKEKIKYKNVLYTFMKNSKSKVISELTDLEKKNP